MTIGEPEIGAFIAVFLRVSGLAMTAPVLGDGGISIRARLVFCVAVTSVVTINHGPVMYDELPGRGIAELATGLIAGLTARFVVARIAIAGQLMGTALGLGFAAQYDPHAGESAGIMRTLASTLGGIAFVCADGLEAIVRSVATPTGPLQLGLLGPDLIHTGTAAFAQGLAIASPIVLAALVANIGFAVMNRATPAVNVFSIALAGVLVLGGALLLGSASSFVASAADAARDAARLLGAP